MIGKTDHMKKILKKPKEEIEMNIAKDFANSQNLLRRFALFVEFKR